MMIEPEKTEYQPRHMKAQAIEEVDLKKLRELVEHLPDGTVLSIALEEVAADGQKGE